ncbi:MAG: DUF167 domain-containing protein [Planctomycetaceae bacterium]
MPDINQIPAGVLVHVKANPKAKRNAITGWHDGRLKVSITVAPENGKANEAIVKLLAKAIGVPKLAIELHRGAKSQLKEFVIADSDIQTVKQRLAARCGLDV